MNERPDPVTTHHHRTVRRHQHVVRRCTNEDQAAKALSEAYDNGFTLLASGVGGTEGNVMWYAFQRVTEEVLQDTPPQQPAVQAPPQPMGGSFG